MIHYIRKFKVCETPYLSIINLIWLLTFMIQTFVQNMAMNEITTYKIYEPLTMLVVIILTIIFVVKMIHKTYKKRKVEVLQSEIEKEYKEMLEII